MKSREAFSGKINDSEIRLLRIFKSVVESGGFSAAEVDLNISRPAISIAVSDLEKRLGLRLCQRGRAGFSLTDEGKEVYDSILQLLTSLETFKSQVNALHSNLRGDLNIGITDNLITIRHMKITNALAALKAKGEGVNINIRMMPSNDVERGVIDGRLHVGVAPMIRALGILEYLPLYEEISHLYCATDHPLFNETLLQRQQVLSEDAVVSAYAQTKKVKELEQLFNVRATASGREGIAFMILTGIYIGFLPSHFAEKWVLDGRMKPLLVDEFNYHTDYAVITRKGARPNLVLETFLNELNTK